MRESALVFAPWPHDRLPPGPLLEHEVVLWAIGLDVADAVLAQLVDELSPEEKVRARSFVFERDRRRYQVTRGFLRRLLSAYAGLPVEQLHLGYGSYGKPALHLQGSRILEFNVAHSGEMAVLAFSAGLPVGVDVEQMRPIPEALEIAKSSFSKKEFEALEKLPDSEKQMGFLRCWTGKEAYAKATGEGLHLALDSFDVSFGPDRNADTALDRVDGQWSLYCLEPSAGYIGALVVAGDKHRLKGWLAKVTLSIDRGE